LLHKYTEGVIAPHLEEHKTFEGIKKRVIAARIYRSVIAARYEDIKPMRELRK